MIRYHEIINAQLMNELSSATIATGNALSFIICPRMSTDEKKKRDTMYFYATERDKTGELTLDVSR